MQRYIKVALDSRGLDETDWLVCERCGKTAKDCHHINGRRGSNYDNPLGLCFLCRDCHLRIHAHNTQENKDILLDIVQKVLN